MKHSTRFPSPNIVGKATLCSGWGGVSDSGALYRVRNANAPDGNDTTGVTLTIDASRSSSTYGKSSTVQPQSVRGLYLIKF